MDTDRENRSTRSKPRTSPTLSTKNFTWTGQWTRVSAVRGRRLTASDMDSKAYHFLLLYFLHPPFSFSFFFSIFLFIFISGLKGSSTVPAYLITIQRYYPNGHSRHSSESFSFAYIRFTNLFPVSGMRHTLKATAVMAQPKWAREVQMTIPPVGLKTQETTLTTPRPITTNSTTTLALRILQTMKRTQGRHRLSLHLLGDPCEQAGLTHKKQASCVRSNGEHCQQVLSKLACVLHVLSRWQGC